MAERRKHSGRTDLRRAGRKRLQDASALLGSGRSHARGAAYLGGYAVECQLKAIAMEVFDCWTLEELAQEWEVDDRAVYTHGLEALVRRLSVYDRFRRSQAWLDFARHVNRWRMHWRYDPHDWDVDAARTFLQAVERVYHWLDRNR